ncbi:MAG TPA: universal stress protein [Nitrolancea sp.]|nr:universal stress protein [Nitrolancea sp.]
MTTMLVPLAGVPRDRHAIRFGQTMARALHGTLELLCLSEPIAEETDPPARSAPVPYLDFTALKDDAELLVDRRIASGHPAEQIAARAAALDDAFVVLALPAAPAAGHRRAWRVAQALLRHCPAPVVLLPARSAAPGSLTSLLVPLDSSPLAQSVLPLVADIAGRSRAVVELVWAEDLGRLLMRYGVGDETDALEIGRSGEIPQLIDHAARLYLERSASHLRTQGIDARWQVLTGGAGAAISREAATTAADLIVMATHGRNRLERLAFGSVTQDVLRQARVPVLVLPPAARRRRLSPLVHDVQTVA